MAPPRPPTDGPAGTPSGTRFLVVSTWLPYPPDNGSRMRAYHLLRHLARRHQVTLLTFGDPESPDALAALRSICSHVEIVPPPLLSGDRLRLRGLFSPVPRYFVQAESDRMRALVADHMRGQDAAICLQVNTAPYLAGHPQVARVLEEVEVGPYLDACRLGRTPLSRGRHRLTWWKFSRFVRGLVGRFDACTVVSSTERDHLVTIGCDSRRIVVVPNGTTADAVLAPRARRPGRLIYPGSVQYSANLDAVRHFVSDVLPLVRRARPDVTFVVTGSTDGVDIRDMAAQPGVTFTGLLPDVEAIIGESAACVVPLRIGGGTRLKVLQAMALGTPVVSTTKGIEGLEVEPETHLLVGDGGPALAAQVLRLLGDPALADTLSTSAHRLVCERDTWDTIGERLEQAIETAVEHHGRRIRARGGAPRHGIGST